jgi:hypothetical protein
MLDGYNLPADTSYDSISLAVTVTGDSQTFVYPTGRTAAFYPPNGKHKIIGRDRTEMRSDMGHFTVTFGNSNIFVVNLTERSFKAGETYYLIADLGGYDIADGDAWPSAGAQDNIVPARLAFIDLGTPATADADGFFASQDLTAAGVASVSTTVAAAIAAAALAGVNAVPRNVVAAWTGAAVITITGTDKNGDVLVESSASGTSLTGKKAFKTVTGISVSANVTSLTVGQGVLLGLPVFLKSAADIIGETLDNAKATAGTVAVGVETTATATTGDVRGTYSPNSAPNGSRHFEMLVAVRSRSYQGVAQFAG